MQHWSSTTHAEFGHKHNILVSWPLPFDFKLIGYPKLKCKGCYWRAVHLLPQVCSFQSGTPGLKRWKMRNTSATSDVIWHQAFCWKIPAQSDINFFVLDLWRLAHQFWVCQEYLRPICQRLTCHGDYAAVLSTTDSTFLCAQGSRVKDVLHGHKGLTSNPGTLALRNTRPYKTLMESCVVTDFCWKYLAFIGLSSSWWNVISSLFLSRCTHGNEIAIGN